ncbi:cobalt-zinc-cadmium resistance protein [Cupriavidus sp. 30B13]|uniref:cobalt-zinc-cadmium resistance protein n=1 Tax=Cupriavidus sp. 30B13 TaxID=3384241 RepID=UPI003B91CBF7
MRPLLLLLTVFCLSLLSFGAAANVHAGSAQLEAAGAAARAQAHAQALPRALDGLDAGADLGRVVAPGDDGLMAEAEPDAVAQDDPPGYCEIWSADLLDPLDLLDEIEESSALFALPAVRVSLPPTERAQQLPPHPAPLPAAFFKPPISLI